MPSFCDWLNNRDFLVWLEATVPPYSDEGALAAKLGRLNLLTHYPPFSDQYLNQNTDYAERLEEKIKEIRDMIEALGKKSDVVEKYRQREPMRGQFLTANYVRKILLFLASELRTASGDREALISLQNAISDLESLLVKPARENPEPVQRRTFPDQTVAFKWPHFRA